MKDTSFKTQKFQVIILLLNSLYCYNLDRHLFKIYQQCFHFWKFLSQKVHSFAEFDNIFTQKSETIF